VYVADRDPAKEQWCEEFGLPFVLTTEDDWMRRVVGSSRGIDCCVNATASGEALQDLIDIAVLEGKIVEASWYGSKPVTLHLGTAFHRKRLRLVSSQVSHIGAPLTARWTKERRFAAAFDLIRKLEPSRLVTHRFPFSNIQAAFEFVSEGREPVMQVLIDV
jgi:threonine dehydrogenase-like Zn-dependent dehydrogenase